MSNKDLNKAKKIKNTIGIMVPTCILAVTAASTPAAIILSSELKKSIIVELSNGSSTDVTIKESNVEKGKESTITLTIPNGKEIETLEIKVGTKELIQGTDYTIDANNKITIKAESVSGENISIKVTTKEKTPEVIKVTSVKIDNTETEIEKLKSINLSATVKPDNAANKNLKWEIIEGATYAHIDESTTGVTKLVADNDGVVKVKATSTDGTNISDTKEFRIFTPEVKVTSVKIDNTEIEIEKLNSIDLFATVEPDNATNKNLKWEVLEGTTGSAHIDETTGVTKLVADKVGNIKVKATSTDGSDISDIKELTVISKVTGIEISQTSLALKPNGEQDIFATITPEDATNKKVKWEVTSGSEFVSIDKAETLSTEVVKVTAIAVGEATITATSDEDSSFSKTCTVNVKDEIISASIKKIHEVEANAVTEAQLTIDPTTTGIDLVEWTAEDTEVVELTPDSSDKTKCSIKGLKNGKTGLTATITDIFGNVKTASTTVYVHQGLFKDQFEFVEQTKANTVWVKRKTSWTVPEDVFVPDCDPSNEDNIVTGVWQETFKSKTTMKTISLPNTITFIGNDTFNGCAGLTSIKIPEQMSDISSYCFLNCSNLVNVELPPNLKSMQWKAFSGCKSLKKIFIPKSVTFLGKQAFQNCGQNVDEFEVEFEDVNPDENVTMTISGECFSSCTTLKTITFPTNKKVEYDTKSSIIRATFANCSSLEKVTLSKNSYATTYLTGSDFLNCTNLTTFEIPSDHPISLVSYDGVENKALVAKKVSTNEQHAILLGIINPPTDVDLDKLGTLTDYPITEIGQYAFRSIPISSINISSNITSIGSYAFSSCTSLASITLPSTLTSIGSYAFSSCTSLASITLPSTLTTLTQELFSGCKALASITIPSTITSIQKDAFKNCSALLNVIVDSATIASIEDNPGQLFNKITGKVIKVPEGTTVGTTISNNYTKSGPEGGYDIYTAS